MSTKLIVARTGMKIEEAVKILVNNKITGLPVVDQEGKMVGILSEYDIIASVGAEKTITPSMFKQEIHYTKEVMSVTDETTFEEILHKFIHLKCRRLPVLDADQHLVGIISRRDIMKALYYRSKVQA